MADRAAHHLPLQGSSGRTLSEALARLAATPAAIRGQASQAAAGREPLMAALLREISETVLPRELTVICGQQTAAVLLVAHRRLAGVCLDRPDDAGTGTGPAPDDPAAAARIFAGRLRALEAAAEAGGFTLRRRPCKTPQGAGSCTVQMLRDALAAEAAGGPLEAFRAIAEAKAEAWMFCSRKAQAPEAHGPENLLRQLDTVRGAIAPSAGPGVSARLPERRPECLLLPVSEH
ncbi:MAG: hypothetical protein AB3N24_02890, partial [Leisingera sp.]